MANYISFKLEKLKREKLRKGKFVLLLLIRDDEAQQRFSSLQNELGYE